MGVLHAPSPALAYVWRENESMFPKMKYTYYQVTLLQRKEENRTDSCCAARLVTNGTKRFGGEEGPQFVWSLELASILANGKSATILLILGGADSTLCLEERREQR